MAQRQAVLLRKDNPPDRAIKSDRAKVVMTAGCISRNIDISNYIYNFRKRGNSINFDLFSKGCGFTDDSIMTIAVGEALLAVGREAAVEEIEEAVVSKMQAWGRRYPYAGYGSKFSRWLREDSPKPYGSYGNGSAMRVSAAGWLYDSLARTREVAQATANVTHNHPEGIKGAEATASAIYMARNGSSIQIP